MAMIEITKKDYDDIEAKMQKCIDNLQESSVPSCCAMPGGYRAPEPPVAKPRCPTAYNSSDRPS